MLHLQVEAYFSILRNLYTYKRQSCGLEGLSTTNICVGGDGYRISP